MGHHLEARSKRLEARKEEGKWQEIEKIGSSI
jgi:hypothetical protein